MKKLTFNSLAFGNLKHRKKQYTLLIIGIILSMVFSSGFVFFVSSAVTSAIETHRFLYGEQSYICTNVITNEDIENVLNETYPKHGYGHILGSITSVAGDLESGTAVGWLEEDAEELYYQSLIEGEMPEKENEIAIEKDALLNLGIEYKLGEKITVDLYVQNGSEIKEKPIKKEYVLVGILNDKKANISDSLYSLCEDIPAAFVADGTKVEVGGKETLHCWLLEGKDSDMGPYIQVVNKYRTPGNDSFGLHLTGGYEYTYTIAEMFGVEAPYLLLLVFVAVLAVVANIGIVNAFSTNLKERKKQIGLLRSVGATKRQIIKIYGRETFVLCLVCTPLSILLSVGAVSLSVHLMGEGFIFKPSWWVLPISAIFSMITVFISSLIPLLSASRISPMQAIRNIQINRKIKTKKITTQKDFDVSRLLASRNIKLYKSKQVLTSIILAIAVFGSIFGFSIVGGMENDNGKKDYDFEAFSLMEYSERKLANYASHYGFSENDKQDLLLNSYVESVSGNKITNGYIEVDELTDYLKVCGYSNGVYEKVFENVKINKKNYKDYEKLPIENLAVKEKADINSAIFPLEFLGLDDENTESLSRTVTVGRVDKDKLDSGEEVVLILPEYMELYTSYDDVYCDSSYLDVNTEHIEEYAENTELLCIAEPGKEFKVGQKIKIGWVGTDSEDEPVDYKHESAEPTVKAGEFEHTKIEKEVTVGAIIYSNTYSGTLIFGITSGQKPYVATTVEGLNNFTKDAPYCGFGVNLNTECTEEINAEIVNILDRITLGHSSGSYNSVYENEKSAKLTADTLTIIIASVAVLLFTLSGSLINNALTARIRESKKEIGTLRAVGASVKDISSSYIRQLLSVLGLGTALGVGAFALFYGIYCLVFISMGDNPDDFVLTFWETIVAIVALFVCCITNVHFKVKKEMKNSIVENIREL